MLVAGSSVRGAWSNSCRDSVAESTGGVLEDTPKLPRPPNVTWITIGNQDGMLGMQKRCANSGRKLFGPDLNLPFRQFR